MLLLERSLQVFQGLQGLPEIVTCGREKNRFGAICPFCELLCTRDLFFEALSLGDVGGQALDARRQSARVEFCSSNLLQPNFAVASSSPVAECDGVRGFSRGD